MSEKIPKQQKERPPVIEGVYFPDYSSKKDNSILVPKLPTKAEILRKETDPGKDKAFQGEKVAVATKLVERCEAGEVFSFPGLRPEKYEIMKRDWEEEPGYATDVDELISRFQLEGMKVAFGDDPTSGNIFLLPAGSNSQEDTLLPRQISVDGIADETLLDLVLMEHFHHLQKQ